MAKLFVSSGKRGRPLSIDPEAELEKLIEQTIPKARARLKEFRKQTRGYRNERILGTDYTLPENIQNVVDVLLDLQESQIGLDYATLKQVKQEIKRTELLASRQKRAYGRAIEQELTEDYIRGLEFSSQNASEFVKESNKRVIQRLKKLTPQQRQDFFLSRVYQDPRTMTGEYENVRAWASTHVGKQLTMQEAWAVIREDDTGSFEGLIEKGYENFIGA